MPASSLTRTVGACSSLSDHPLHRPGEISAVARSSSGPSLPVSRSSSASTTSAAFARSAITVGDTRAACRAEMRAASSSATICPDRRHVVGLRHRDGQARGLERVQAEHADSGSCAAAAVHVTRQREVET